MGVTAISGPQVVFGITQGSTGAVGQYNEERGPSTYDLGTATADPRYYFSYKPGAPVGTQIKGFFDNAAFIDFVPFTGSSALGLTATTIPTAGVALTLAPSTALGTFQTTIVAPENGQTVSVIALDSTASVLTFGTGGTIATWNPAAGAGRKVTLTPSGNSSLDGGSWSIAGRDMYGIEVSETIAASSQAMTSAKTYKYITSIAPTTTVGSTGVSVGLSATVFGLPLYAGYNSIMTQCRVNATSSVTATPAQSNVAVTVGATATATSTTGDVRGTWASSVSANGTARIQILQYITPAMVSSVTASDTSGMFGVAQYSSV